MSNYSGNVLNDEDKNSPWFKIAELIKPKSRVLDIGCSSGNLGAELIRRKKCEVIGIDLNEKDVKQASKRLAAAYVRNAEIDDLSDLGKFDHIIFADVIEHLAQPPVVLKKVKALLKNNGTIVFSIPNMAHMGTRLMVMGGEVKYGETGLLDKTHLHYYDQDEVRRVFSEANFKITDLDWSERYIPESTLRAKLKKIGLDPQKKFFELSKTVDATAYEFIGQASPSENAKQAEPLPFASPYVFTAEEQMQNVKNEYEARIADLHNHYLKQLKGLEQKNIELTNSLSWRVTAPLRSTRAAVKQVTRKRKSGK